MPKKTIYIADDHQMMLDGLLSMLNDNDELEVVKIFMDGKQALKEIEYVQPDILITDIKMPEMNGLELTKAVKSKFSKVKVLVLSMHNEPKMVEDISLSGADGYILKNTGKPELLEALNTILEGKKYFGKDVMDALLNRMTSKNQASDEINLTFREKDVLKLIVDGKSATQISEELHISTHTVDTHRKNIMRKTDTHNVAELVRFVYEKGLV